MGSFVVDRRQGLTHEQVQFLMTRYKGRASRKNIERDFPHVVQMRVPHDGFGRRLDAMHEWCGARGTKLVSGGERFDEGDWYVAWRFTDIGVAAAFKAEFAS